MCGRFVATTDQEGLVRLFLIDDRQAENLPPSWNVAPTDLVYAVAAHEGRRVLVSFRWGLVPSWAKDRRVASRHINARAETVASKPTFASSFKRRRCLVPADGFYEWRVGPDGSRTPYFIRRADGTPMAFAGLWASWRGADDGSRLLSCTIVTTQAHGKIAALHERMPVFLEPARFSDWLDRDTDPALLSHLLGSADPEVLTWQRVSTAVNSVRNNHPDLIAPLAT